MTRADKTTLLIRGSNAELRKKQWHPLTKLQYLIRY